MRNNKRPILEISIFLTKYNLRKKEKIAENIALEKTIRFIRNTGRI